MPANVFEFIGDSTDSVVDAFLVPTATNVIDVISPFAVGCVTVYFMLTGYQIITGAMQEYFWTFLVRSARILFITVFALNIGNYTYTVLGFFDSLESGLTTALSVGGGGGNIYTALDDSFNRGLDAVDQCFINSANAGWDVGTAVRWIICGIIVAIGTVFISALGGAMVIMAKFGLAILFALGPLFFVALMFPVTARMFDSWLVQVFNYILTIVVMALIMTFCMAVYNAAVGASDFSGEGVNSGAAEGVKLLLVTIVLFVFIKRGTEIASSLAGGISLAAMGVRHFVSPISDSARAGKTSIDLAKQVYSGGRQGVEKVLNKPGGTVEGAARPSYRQTIMSNLRKWQGS